MAYLNKISILIEAKDTATAVLDGTARNLEGTAAKMETMGSKAMSVGSSMTKFVTLPVLGVAAASIKMAGDFQASMVRLVTSAGESENNLKSVSAGVLQVAKDTGTSTTELAKALYTIESGGQHGADGLLVLKAAAQGAKAENSDLATVADAVTSVLVDYHLKASDAALVTTKLVAATSAGKTTFEELAAAMPAILPVASAAHVALSDILGDLAAMTIHGMSAQQSAQNLADVIRHMQNPTAMQAKELALLGLTTTQLAGDLKDKGLSGTLQEISTKIENLMPPGSDKVILNLKTALSGLSPKVQELGMQLFNGTMSSKDYQKAASGLDVISAKQATSFATLAGSTHRIGDQQMTGAQVMQNYGQALAKATGDATGLNVALMLSGENAGTVNGAIKTVSGAANEAGGNVKGWADIQSTFNFRLAQFKENLQTSAISLGNKLLPVMTTFVKHITDLVGWFERLSPTQKKFLEWVVGLAAVMGPAILIVGKFASAITAITGAVGGAGKAMGLFKTTGIVSEAAKGVKALGAGEGLAGAMSGLAPEAAAAGIGLAPVALGLAAVAAVGVGAALIVKHVSDSHKEAAKQASDQAAKEAGVAKQLSTAGGAHTVAKGLIDNYNKSADAELKTSDKKYLAYSNMEKAQGAYNTAVDKTRAALKKYGDSSPQYLAAIESEASANSKLGDATKAYSGLADAAGRAHDNVNKAADRLNGTYFTSQQYTAKLSKDTDGLSKAKGNEKTAHEKTGAAASNYAAIIKAFGPDSQQALEAAQHLTDRKNDETKAQQSVSWWTQQVKTDLDNEAKAVDNLNKSLDTLSSKSPKLFAAVNASNNGKGYATINGIQVPKFAGGVNNFSGGAAVVGEQGPELVYLPQGSGVTPAGKTRQILSGGGSSAGRGTTVHIENLNTYNNIDVRRIIRDIGLKLAAA